MAASTATIQETAMAKSFCEGRLKLAGKISTIPAGWCGCALCGTFSGACCTIVYQLGEVSKRGGGPLVTASLRNTSGNKKRHALMTISAGSCAILWTGDVGCLYMMDGQNW